MGPQTRAIVEGSNADFAAIRDYYRENASELRDTTELLAWLGALRDMTARQRMINPIVGKDGIIRQSPLLKLTVAIIDAVIKIERLEREADRRDSVPIKMVQSFMNEVVDIIDELASDDDERERLIERLHRRIPACEA